MTRQGRLDRGQYRAAICKEYPFLAAYEYVDNGRVLMVSTHRDPSDSTTVLRHCKGDKELNDCVGSTRAAPGAIPDYNANHNRTDVRDAQHTHAGTQPKTYRWPINGVRGTFLNIILNARDTWLLASDKDGSECRVQEFTLKLGELVCTQCYRRDTPQVQHHTPKRPTVRASLHLHSIKQPGFKQRICIVCACIWCRWMCETCNQPVCRKCQASHASQMRLD